MDLQPTERAALNRIRLDEDLTYDALAAQIGLSTGSVLFRLLHRTEGGPLDRTVHKVRRYLAARETLAAPTRKPRRAR